MSRRLLIYLILSIIMSGCAYGTRRVELSYPAQEKSYAHMATKNSLPRIAVMLFEDGREDKNRIGHVQNGYGAETANIVVKNNVAEWVTKALEAELNQQGYDVFRATDKNSAKDSSLITGAVTYTDTTAEMKYEADVSILIRVEKNGEKILEKSYTGKTKAGLNLASRGKNFGKALNAALALAIKGFLEDFANPESASKGEGRPLPGATVV